MLCTVPPSNHTCPSCYYRFTLSPAPHSTITFTPCATPALRSTHSAMPVTPFAEPQQTANPFLVAHCPPLSPLSPSVTVASPAAAEVELFPRGSLLVSILIWDRCAKRFKGVIGKGAAATIGTNHVQRKVWASGLCASVVGVTTYMDGQIYFQSNYAELFFKK